MNFEKKVAIQVELEKSILKFWDLNPRLTSSFKNSLKIPFHQLYFMND